MDHKKYFGKIMREARKKKGVSYRELAEIVGVTSTYCRYIEHGQYTPTWVIWFGICTALDIDIKKVSDVCAAPDVRERKKLMGLYDDNLQKQP